MGWVNNRHRTGKIPTCSKCNRFIKCRTYNSHGEGIKKAVNADLLACQENRWAITCYHCQEKYGMKKNMNNGTQI